MSCKRAVYPDGTVEGVDTCVDRLARPVIHFHLELYMLHLVLHILHLMLQIRARVDRRRQLTALACRSQPSQSRCRSGRGGLQLQCCAGAPGMAALRRGIGQYTRSWVLAVIPLRRTLPTVRIVPIGTNNAVNGTNNAVNGTNNES